MKLEKIDKSKGFFGRRIFWQDSSKNDLAEIKLSADNRILYFIRNDATYALPMTELVDEVEKLINKKYQ